MISPEEPLGPLRERLKLRPYGGAPDDPTPGRGRDLASVAVILREAGISPDLLLIQRAIAERDPWSGHMAFPGGRREDADSSLLDTAIRETHEETGIDLGREGEPLGRLSLVEPASPRLPPLSILPFVFSVPGGTRVAELSPEVADTFWVPLSYFRDPEIRTSYRLPVGEGVLSFPAFALGDRVVWGLTHRILQDLLGRLGETR